jgi:hypothetical protein
MKGSCHELWKFCIKNGAIDEECLEHIKKFSIEKVELVNITRPDYFAFDLVHQSVEINLVETIYANLKDIFPDTPPTSCEVIGSDEEVSKVLLQANLMATFGLLAYDFSGITVTYCENATDKKECINEYFNSLKTIAEEKKNSLPNYREIKLSKCPETLVYLQVKDLEKEIRNQLANSVDPFSIMIKSLQIDMYNKCSQEMYEGFIVRYGCPIIPHKKSDAVRIIITTAGIFSFCSSGYVKNETTFLREQLIGK